MLETVPQIESTSSALIARLAAGERIPEGHWLIADRQTAGRGRLARQWFDGSGNFMGSTIVALRDGDPDPATLALVAGLASHAAAAPHVPGEAGLVLKWPNDLLIGDAKLSGILLERSGQSVIVGIGVNLAVAPPVEGCMTVAISQFGSPPARDDFARQLADCFAEELARWRSAGLPQVIRRWVSLAHPIGTALTVTLPDGTVLSGAFGGLDESGSLQLRLADGAMRAIHAGDVHLARASD